MKKFTFLFLALVIGFGIFTAQSKYNDDPRWSSNPNSIILPSGNGVSAPINTIPITIFQKPAMVYNTPFGPLTVNQNIRPHPSANQHNEVYITRHPSNQNILLVANQPIGLPATWIQAGLYFSTNSGLSWYGDDTLNAPSLADQRGDPAPTIDKNGTMIYTHLTSTTNFGGLKGMGANYSTDNGNTFSATWDVEVNSNLDKNMSCTDDAPTSPYYGNSYMAYTLFNGTAANGHFSRTTNGGQSWSTFLVLNNTPANHFAQGHDLRVGPDGAVYVVWSAESSTSPYPADYLGVAKSTNGGLNFTVTENAYDMNGARSGSYNSWGIRTNDFPRIDIDKTGGTRNGWIYVVAGEYNLAPAGTDQDIILHRSTDGGVTWNSPGIRVNQDALNNGKVQFFPAVRVDEYGGVNVIYYDNRNFPSVGDSCSVFISRSIDGGNTFTDIEIADHHFKPKLLSGVNTMGDYIGITSANNKIWGAWTDDKTPLGNFQIWLGSIDLGPAITHTPLTNTEQTTGTRAVNCIVIPAGSPLVTSLTKLFVAKNAGAYDSVQLTNSSGNNWTGNITLSGAGTYKYYIRTVDNLNRVAFAPGGAPANYYSFQAMPDTVKPAITHTPLPDCPKTAWPSTVTASVTDNIGVDSVWVTWKKNYNGISKRFKLNFTSGTTYTAAFNSIQSEVNFNDTISYKVVAQDISSNHNRDSTALFKFKIISQATACIGTGTTSSNFPFTTYWMDGRTDYLYTAAEILAAGGGAGSISKVGFTVLTANPAAMNGFKVKFQLTSLTTLTGFTSTGWTTCYDAAYTVPGTGLQYITLTTPFQWNGTSNLLMEICYNNSAYTQYSTVNSTAAPGMFWGRYGDLSTADGCATETWSSTTAPPGRANTCFVIDILAGANNNFTNVPNVYDLSQNYPNPFNPVTQIKYAIPEKGFVTMKVFDVLGREVSKLVNKEQSAGNYIVDFDGTNLASGIYFYKLEINSFRDVKRMMLIK